MCAWCEYYHIPNFGVITFCLWCSRVIHTHTHVHTISNQNLCHLIRLQHVVRCCYFIACSFTQTSDNYFYTNTTCVPHIHSDIYYTVRCFLSYLSVHMSSLSDSNRQQLCHCYWIERLFARSLVSRDRLQLNEFFYIVAVSLLLTLIELSARNLFQCKQIQILMRKYGA